MGSWRRPDLRFRFEALSDGSHFAKQGVVFISNNRRLGAEGYLYLEELFGDGVDREFGYS